MADFEDLEKLVAAIQKQLAPASDVQHNVKLDGRHSRTKRRIDVLVSQKIGQYEIKIVIDCKDYKDPVDVKGVEEFHGLLTDVGAQKGVLVCPAGFSKAAKWRAQDLLIDLYSPVDTGPHKWKATPFVPVICDFRNAAISFKFSCSAPYPCTIKSDFYSSNIAYDATGNALGTAIGTAIRRWNDGEFPNEAGIHEDLLLFPTREVHTDNGHGMRIPVSLSANLYVKKQLYFGNFPIIKMSGFKDEIKGGVITNAFTVGMLDPDKITRKWKKIDTEEQAPIQPVMRMVGLYGWADPKVQ